MNKPPGTLLSTVSISAAAEKYSDWQRRWATALAPVRYTALVVPVVLAMVLLWAIWSYTGSVPFEDEWANVPIVHSFLTGTFSLGEVWAFHNQHRIVIPRLVDLLLTVVTHWNRQVEMTVDVIFAVASTWLLFASLKKTILSNLLAWIFLIPASLLMLSWGQYENWLEPFQITFILTIVGVSCCVRGLVNGKTSIGGFILAIFGATIAALSSLGGTIAFIAFFPIILSFGWRRSSIWVAVALGVLVPYFLGFPHSSLDLQPVGIAQYVLAYLGAPLVGWHLDRAIAAGLVSLVLAGGSVIIYWRQHGSLYLMGPWIGLGLFALGVAGITALGRNSGGGLIYSLSSRYQAFSGVWWVTIFALIAICLAEVPRTSMFLLPASDVNRWLVSNAPSILQGCGVMASICLVVLIGLNNLSNEPALQLFQSGQVQQQSCIKEYIESQPDCFHFYYPWPGTAQAYSAILQEDNMSVFYRGTGGESFGKQISTSVLALDRYIDPRTHTYWSAVALNVSLWDNDLAPQYKLDKRLGYLLPGPQTSRSVRTVPIFGCYWNGVEYLSLDATCGGLSTIQVEGWLYTAAPLNVKTLPLFQCAIGTGYITANVEGCGLHLTWTLLGFLQSSP